MMSCWCRRKHIKVRYNVIRAVIFVASVAFAATASCPPWQGPGIVIGPAGERLCAKHREPLQVTTVYGPGDGVCVLVQPTKEMAKARACSPNALPFGVSRSLNQLYSRAVETSYCSRCEANLQAHVRR
jgi:hypothetical protein